MVRTIYRWCMSSFHSLTDFESFEKNSSLNDGVGKCVLLI